MKHQMQPSAATECARPRAQQCRPCFGCGFRPDDQAEVAAAEESRTPEN